jgi:ABC-2 type transport system permease protein
MSPVVRRLIVKDLYLLRWTILGAIVSGLGAVVILPLTETTRFVGGVLLICVLIILNIVLLMQSVVQERKDKVLLFVLSLPVSTTQYMAAKVAASGIAFLVPWLLLTAATAVTISVSQIPDGVLPFWIAVLFYLLCYFCVLLAVSLATESSGWHAAAITIGNISVNFLIPFLLSRRWVNAYIEGPIPVWTPQILIVIAIELVVGVAAIGLAAYQYSRRPDFV